MIKNKVNKVTKKLKLDRSKAYDDQALKYFFNILKKNYKQRYFSELVYNIGKKKGAFKNPKQKYFKWATELFNAVKKRIEYQPDPYSSEKYSTPLDIWLRKYGDCDDFAMIISTLLWNIGIPIRIILAGYRKSKTGKIPMSHIYVKGYINKKWLNFDGVIKKPGFLEKRFLESKIYSISPKKGIKLLKVVKGNLIPKTKTKKTTIKKDIWSKL